MEPICLNIGSIRISLEKKGGEGVSEGGGLGLKRGSREKDNLCGIIYEEGESREG
jgi:hypothetical protein